MTLGPRSSTSPAPVSSRGVSMRNSNSAIGRPQVVATVTGSSSARHMVPNPVASVRP